MTCSRRSAASRGRARRLSASQQQPAINHQPRTPPRLLVSTRKQRRTQGHSVWKRPGCIGAPSMRANPLALQSTLWFRGPAPDAGVSAKSRLRRLSAAKTGRIECEGTSHGAFWLQMGNRHPNFASAGCRSDCDRLSGKRQGGETENATAVWGHRGFAFAIGRGGWAVIGPSFSLCSCSRVGTGGLRNPRRRRLSSTRPLAENELVTKPKFMQKQSRYPLLV